MQEIVTLMWLMEVLEAQYLEKKHDHAAMALLGAEDTDGRRVIKEGVSNGN